MMPSNSGLFLRLPPLRTLQTQQQPLEMRSGPAVIGPVGHWTTAESLSVIPKGECHPPSHTGRLVGSRRHGALGGVGLGANEGEALGERKAAPLRNPGGAVSRALWEEKQVLSHFLL